MERAWGAARMSVAVGIVMIATPLFAAAAAAGMAEPKVEYSADQYLSTGEQTVKSRVFHAKGKQRMELDLGGTRQAVITRFDKNLSWILMLDEKRYMETTLGEGKAKSNDIRECTISQKTAGTEVVNGVSATRSEIDATCPDKTRFSGSMWTTRDGILVKLDAVAKGKGAEGRMKIELRNLKIGKQDPKLFEVPPGFTKLAVPGGFDTKGMMKAPTAPPKAVEKPSNTGRSYTAQPRDTGRSYTAQPRTGETKEQSKPEEKGALDKALDTGKKLKGLLGW
ncbi:MAG: DUF4412 domain-containing protein [Deltaproteobacteria bacterium]|nr:DUF4412 domain-containing protein [Deltaproteobacteria bacterium]